MKDLKDKVVLVTGAARGMGRLHALTFAREGARVVITDIDSGELAATESEMREAGYDVHAYRQDISNREECFALAARVEEEVGPVDICSMAGKVAAPYLGAYCATKFALVGLTDALRQELKGSGVGTTIVNPGYITTGMFEGARAPWVTRWQDPQKVADAVLRAVREDKCEVFVPRFVAWLSGFGRGLGMPRFGDFLITLFGGRQSFKGMIDERNRPF